MHSSWSNNSLLRLPLGGFNLNLERTARNYMLLIYLAIFHYAPRVRQDWHDRLKREQGFNICIIKETVPRSISEELWDKLCSHSLSQSPAHLRTHFLLKCTGPRPSTSDICNLLCHDRKCTCSFRRCVKSRFLRYLPFSSLLIFYLCMRNIRPCTFHAGHAPSLLSCGPCALASFMQANHAPHVSCGPIMCPRTFHAGQSCALAPFMRANYEPSAALAPFMQANQLSCAPTRLP